MSDLRIHAALSPRVAVLSSPDVDRVVQLNGIPDLSTLLRPFESSVERLSVRTSLLETRFCDRFPLRFDSYSLFNPDAVHAISLSSSQHLPRPSTIGHFNEELLDRVNHLIATNIKKWDAQVARPVAFAESIHPPKDTRDEDEDGDTKSSDVLDETLAQLQRGSLEETAPWFVAVQQLVFGQRGIAKHESFGHPVAILLAVSSASADPMNDFAKLYEATTQSSPFPAHPYINPDTLRYYVLIHDVRTSGSDLASSKEILEQVKKTYGLHCCLLAINSASDDRSAPAAELAALWKPHLPSLPTSPALTSPTPDAAPSDVATLLDAEDVKRIKGFIRELTAQSIVPFMERYVQHMGEHLANSRKGLTNRLFGASRKLFGGVASVSGSGDKSGSSTPGGLATTGGYDPQNDFYPFSSIEAQTRRLADFAFTIRDYKLAASMYDLGRKDFVGDKAYRHAAGATEMFGLSHLMIMYTSRSAPIDVDSYLAQACHDYALRSPARSNAPMADENYALRATLLYYEAYRMLGYLRPAPAGLLRMSVKSDEVLAPLLLEQAALACLQLKPRPALRKYALHLVTAAHKFQACGQKILSLRCYAQAAVVYRQKGWALIENHIEHELGMQAYNEGDSDAALVHLIKLVRPSANSTIEHEGFLRDVQTAYKYSSSPDAETKTLSLPFPLFDTASASLLFVPESSASATSTINEEVWEKLGQDLVDHGLGDRTMADGSKKRRKRPTSHTSTQARQVPINQTFWLDVEVRNPLGVELTIVDIRPILKIDTLDTAEELDRDDVETGEVQKLTLGPLQRRRVRIPVRVKKQAKSLRVASVYFRLAETVHLIQHMEKKGKRLNSTKQQRTSITYGADLSLVISVHGARPTLTAKIVDPPQHMLLGEQLNLKVMLKNQGNSTIQDVRALCDRPEMATFDNCQVLGIDSGDITMSNDLGPSVPQTVLNTDNAKLEPGEEVQVNLTIRPVRTGIVSLAWLLAFCSDDDDNETYLSRMAFSTSVASALHISVETSPSRNTDCTHDVVIEAKNQLVHQEVRLDSLSVLSPVWKIDDDDSAPTNAGRDIQGNGTGMVLIAPLQTWRGRFRIKSVAKQIEMTKVMEEWTATKLQDLLLSRDIKRPPAPDSELHTSMQRCTSSNTKAATSGMTLALHREGRKQWRQRSVALMLPAMTARDRTSAFTLWESRDLDVMVQFSVESDHNHHAQHKGGSQERRTGWVQVFGLQPGPLCSQIRALTHPQLNGLDKAADGGQVRSLYAETIKEKASVLQNIVSSRLGMDQNPTLVFVQQVVTASGGGGGGWKDKDGMIEKKFRWVVRNFSDRYTVKVEIQLLPDIDQGGGGEWLGRNTLRCKLQAGEIKELIAMRRGDEEENGESAVLSPRFDVVTESYLPITTTNLLDAGGDGEEEEASMEMEMVARYVEHY
ncbi:uncharacterized protein MEPE_03988 [Melanopsichium pennsylvanicum]|uniref:TPPC8 first Ig-like domain-containing protein n=2 Tax=Melanopsichium pennsylvanicum TaxID=63383 RepID=A0AAJ4XMW4_9BASI|nr:conserved hypothetical protein [Melanopsichium pennsylvanicum 4]SNX85279.1 uncharacterized protein MEPE_03988 [Melanopsichium pennsylvanicum]